LPIVISKLPFVCVGQARIELHQFFGPQLLREVAHALDESVMLTLAGIQHVYLACG